MFRERTPSPHPQRVRDNRARRVHRLRTQRVRFLAFMISASLRHRRAWSLNFEIVTAESSAARSGAYLLFRLPGRRDLLLRPILGAF